MERNEAIKLAIDALLHSIRLNRALATGDESLADKMEEAIGVLEGLTEKGE